MTEDIQKESSKKREERLQEATLAATYESDEAIVARFQQGEIEAFRHLVDRHSEKIRNLIFSIFNDPDAVDDLAQDVFIRAYQALPKFRSESKFYTWLYQIAINKSRDEMRKRKVRRFLSLQTLMESGEYEPQAHTSHEQDDVVTQEVVQRALQSLPEKYRIPIVLKDVDGFSYEEMADIMNCGVGTVKSRLSRARTMMREKLIPILGRCESPRSGR